jgi:flagellar hook protein FlgE
MSFYTSLSGLKGAQSDLSTISNNIANSGSIAFKRSRAQFGDVFAAAPTQTTRTVAGQGTRLNGVLQQFTQGSLEATDKTLDLGIVGEGFFAVRSPAPRSELTFTRNGAFTVRNDRAVVDTIGSTLQLMPIDANGVVTSSAVADQYDFILPATDPADSTSALVNVSVSNEGVVTATFANGNQQRLGAVAMASFTALEGLRPTGESHWQATGESGPPNFNQALKGTLGAVRSGALERSNVDLTEELVALIGAQRNFQANAQAIETANNMTQTIFNIN